VSTKILVARLPKDYTAGELEGLLGSYGVNNAGLSIKFLHSLYGDNAKCSQAQVLFPNTKEAMLAHKLLVMYIVLIIPHMII
jgi:hypothetical protein